jgi:hypothetical protein
MYAVTLQQIHWIKYVNVNSICNVLLHRTDFIYASSFYMHFSPFLLLVVHIYIHYMFRPKWPSSEA